MNQDGITFPIVPNVDEEKLLSEWISSIRRINEDIAKYAWSHAHAEITSNTRTDNLFGPWNNSKYVFEPLADHILKSVLLVALRFKWPPEEILALWQIEGLPCFTGHMPRICGRQNLEKEGVNWDPLPIKDHELLEPRGRNSEKEEAEARAFARSIVLYERWGLDVLTPTRHRASHRDNVLQKVRRRKHDEAFEAGFSSQIRPFLPSSPFEYLTDQDWSPVVVRKRSGRWEYGTDSEYQTTMLAMQYARFKYLQTLIPAELKFKGITLNLEPAFPGLVRTYYNCKKVQSRRILMGAVKDLVSLDIKEIKARGMRKDSYDTKELEVLFTTRVPPRYIRQSMRSDYGPGLCYLGGLRFEVLRRTYKTLFSNTL